MTYRIPTHHRTKAVAVLLVLAFGLAAATAPVADAGPKSNPKPGGAFPQD